MNLKDIGFYTLSDERAKYTAFHINNDLQMELPINRCEMVVTNKCNFKCEYCRGLRDDLREDVKRGLDYTFSDSKNIFFQLGVLKFRGVNNFRFSGGEPTIFFKEEESYNILDTVKNFNPKHIAISTNGSANIYDYYLLYRRGINDFSISLDACTAEEGDAISGVEGSWNIVVENIKELSKIAYVTLGIVVTEKNVERLGDILIFANSLGVADIRVIPSAQYDSETYNFKRKPSSFMFTDRYPILKYRMENIQKGIHCRGLKKKDCSKCHLVLDDIAIAGGKHFPCIIYMREKGKEIGEMTYSYTNDRIEWWKNHNPHNDPICQKNCLDVCIDYNNKVEGYLK